MVLIILTENDYENTIKVLFKKSMFILIPLSILFIKYYPEIGRSYDFWTGEVGNSGAAQDKNALGRLCMVYSIFLLWSFNRLWKMRKVSKIDFEDLIVHITFFAMIFWLIIIADSATSLMGFMIGFFIYWLMGLPAIRRTINYMGVYIILILVLIFISEVVINLSEIIIVSLGRDATLTGRTILWEELLQIRINTLIGTGYESFWLGERLEAIWANNWWHPNQAHNGYLEMYLNLGIIGLTSLVLFIINGFKNIKYDLINNFDFGRFRMSLFIITLIYNLLEAAFKGMSIIWFVFLVVSINVINNNRANFYPTRLNQ